MTTTGYIDREEQRVLELLQPDGKTSRADSTTMFGKDGMSFADALDVINPLQQLPIVGTIYREITGDTIKPASRIIGGTLFGGPLGLMAASLDSMYETATGKDFGQSMVAMVTEGEMPQFRDQPPTDLAPRTLLASADPTAADAVSEDDRGDGFVAKTAPVTVAPVTVAPVTVAPVTTAQVAEPAAQVAKAAAPAPSPTTVASGGVAQISGGMDLSKEPVISALSPVSFVAPQQPSSPPVAAKPASPAAAEPNTASNFVPVEQWLAAQAPASAAATAPLPARQQMQATAPSASVPTAQTAQAPSLNDLAAPVGLSTGSGLPGPGMVTPAAINAYAKAGAAAETGLQAGTPLKPPTVTNVQPRMPISTDPTLAAYRSYAMPSRNAPPTVQKASAEAAPTPIAGQAGAPGGDVADSMARALDKYEALMKSRRKDGVNGTF